LKDGLALLLEKLAAIEDLRWVRFLYAYPNKITGKLLDTIASHEKICSYMDVPLQHASASVLKRMKRGGGADVFLKSIEKMRRVIPDLTLRTSFIVGFPCETEQAFHRLMGFVREQEFDRVGVFTYSPEEGTSAYNLPGQVPEREKRRRRAQLMEAQAEISLRRNRALIGKEVQVLVEGQIAGRATRMRGRTPWQAPEIDGMVVLRGAAEPGEFVCARVKQALTYDLVAEVVGAD